MQDLNLRLSELIELLYAATQDDDWSTFLRGLASTLNADKAVLAWGGPLPGHLLFVASKGFSAKDGVRYQRRYAQLDPWRRAVANLPANSDYLTHELSPKGFLDATVIQREFLEPLNIHFGVGGVFNTPHGPGQVALYRGKAHGPFDDTDRKRLIALLPHLSRAFGIQVERIEQDGHWYASRSALNQMGVGVIFVNEAGAPTFLNDKATELVTKCHGVKVVDGGIFATRAGEKETFQALLDGVIASAQGKAKHNGGRIRLTCPKSAQPISALVLPLKGMSARPSHGLPRACATIILSSPREQEVVSERDLMRLYQLSHLEAELVVGLVQGQTLNEFTEASGKSPNTIRARMKSIFQKTKTSRQVELLQAILTGPAMMREKCKHRPNDRP